VPLKVCHVITGFDTGGAERVLMQTVRRLDARRFTSQIVSLRPRGPLSADAERLGVEVTHLGMWRRAGPLTLWKLTHLLRRARVQIVHAYLYDASLAVRIAGRVAGVPVVLTSTRASLGYLPGVAWWVDRLTARWCDRVIAVSASTAKFVVEVERIPREKVVVISNGVDLQRFRPTDGAAARRALGIPSDAFVVACVGRLHELKGQRELLDALALMRGQRPGLVCLFAGTGPDRLYLEARVRDLGLENICRFLGPVEQVETVYAAADVAVLPSRFEGMPNTVLEAMAMARPVVATAVDGSTELVRSGDTGTLVPRGDVRALATGLLALARDPQRRAAMGARARQLAEQHHGIDRSVASIEALYAAEWERASRGRGA
jgi:glycosyltransferase involved in cell wall biosynthesis